MATCHDIGIKIDIPEGAKKIVLVGNPNVGKSVFFNALTGVYVDVSNYPGTTLEISHGRFGQDVVIDTPGVYGISSFNDEESVARDVILSADIILNVVDAVHLERDLFLTLQVIDTGIPVIVAINMIDEARKQGIEIDIDLLTDLLGVPVIPTVAVSKIGLNDVKEQLYTARKGHIDHQLEKLLKDNSNCHISQGENLLILEGDPVIAERNGVKPSSYREEIYIRRRDLVNDIVKHVAKESDKGASFTTKLGRWMIKPLTGIPILIIVLWAMYFIIGDVAAQRLVGFTEGVIMKEYYEPFVRSLIGNFISPHSIIGKILIGEFGLVTMTVTYVVGLLLPLVAAFYVVLSTMEDSGYLPRLATLVDRVLNTIGLNGRAVIPMILGFGCVTMATMTTRLLGSEREKRITIFVLGLAIPCSAQLGVIVALLTPLGFKYTLLYGAILLTVLVSVGTIMNKTLPGESSGLLIDLPPIRLPRIRNILTKTFNKSYLFIKEATPLFALGAFIITVLQLTGFLKAAQNFLAPMTIGWLNLPKETATVFIMGLVRRDFGAAGLYNMNLTSAQTITALITITLFVPCIASVMIIFKERGWKEASIMWLGTWVIAFLVGGVVAQLFNLFI